MTAHRDLKTIIRARMAKTGESYTAARLHVLSAQGEHMADEGSAETLAAPLDMEVAVLRRNARSARVRDLATGESFTLRSSLPWLVPGHVANVKLTRRWSFRGHPYAAGTFGALRIDARALRLEPLALQHHGERDFFDGPSDDDELDVDVPDPVRRSVFEMDVVPFVADDDLDEDDPIIAASELNTAGYRAQAEEILAGLLADDLRCLDAHAHLGNFAFDRDPERALVHYEVGVRIGELSLPASFHGVLPWGYIGNRPFFRCAHGRAIALWRLGRLTEAEAAFERMLQLDPDDNKAAGSCRDDVRAGVAWQKSEATA
jgi:tetratricopeptide (TPR) repeat protein